MPANRAQQRCGAGPCNARHALECTAQPSEVIARITSEQLVSPFAGQDNLHVLTRESAQRVEAQGVRMTEWFVVVENEAVQCGLDILWLEDDDMMPRTGTLSRVAGEICLIPGRVLKT